MRRRRDIIQIVQWTMVVLYLLMLVVPAVLPLPGNTAHILDNITLFAQFIFWGLWWPFVLVSAVLLGRFWCGIFCPEGTLTEFASRHGRHRAIPKWIRWRGWPVVAFMMTTIYGQLISVYQYPKATLLLLGGSTVAAVVIGFLYGREKRVWCRYLCPVSGVFHLLAKLAPLHYRVDSVQWLKGGQRQEKFNCAPLVAVRVMKGGADCHMCGRCSGYRDAVALCGRSPNREIVALGAELGSMWEQRLLIYGVIGVAMGAFHWNASPWFVAIKQHLASFLLSHDLLWPLTSPGAWWMLTDYPAQSDVFNWLDGAMIVSYILTTAILLGATIEGLLRGAAKILRRQDPGQRIFLHLGQSLVPIGACGLFLGLSGLTVTMLRAEHVYLAWVPVLRMLLLDGACIWSAMMAWRIAGQHAGAWPRLLAMLPVAMALGAIATGWVCLYVIW
ncbi:MAG: 4Fe-4S binding protein [Proteobacteria bacterium]|nr:4Fe-4S binding protein [Pseudomonadota bacterium]